MLTDEEFAAIVQSLKDLRALSPKPDWMDALEISCNWLIIDARSPL